MRMSVKRIMIAMLAGAIVVGSMPMAFAKGETEDNVVPTQTAQTQAYDSVSNKYENEPNNEYDTANPIDPNDSISGNLQSRDDVDVFKVVAPSDGKLSVDFCHIYSDSENSWDVSVIKYYNGNYHEMCGWNIDLDDNEKISLPYIGATANSEYYIKISHYKFDDKILGVDYTINTSFEASNSFEKEFNGQYSIANNVSVGENINGNLGKRDDIDIFKVVPSEDGKLSIDFCHKYYDSENSWDVSIIKYDNGAYKEMCSLNIDLDDNEKISFPYIGASSNDNYYIKVSHYKFDDYIIGKNYTLNTSLYKWVQNESGQWMYLKDGVPQTGWVLDGALWYYLNSAGIMQTGWINDGGVNWYYLNGSGVMQTGWVHDGAWYYMASNGVMQTGWVKDKGKWYYLNSSGAMCTGWIHLDAWYCLGSDGAMYANCRTPDGYWVDKNGRYIPGR